MELHPLITRRDVATAIRNGAMDFYVSSYIAFGDFRAAERTGDDAVIEAALDGFEGDATVLIAAFEHVAANRR